MYVVGLTGGIGSGKSTVAARLAELGAGVVDADRIAREIVEPGQPALDELVERFGEGILNDDGTLDRRALAEIAFADDDARSALNAITHPRISHQLLERLGEYEQALAPDGIVVLDVPLLTESSPLAQGTHAMIVVEAPEELRVQRVVDSRDMTADDVRARIRAQASDEERRRGATHVIDNRGDLDHLYAQVDAVYEQLQAAAREQATEASALPPRPATPAPPPSRGKA